jgi:hypothetical protein
MGGALPSRAFPGEFGAGGLAAGFFMINPLAVTYYDG